MSVRNPVYYNGKYFMGDMTTEQAEKIISVIKAEEIPELKHMIFDFPEELVLESMETGESIRDMLISRGEDLAKYIGELRDYQTVGTAFMFYSPRSILGDGVGSGKTAEIAALINLTFKLKYSRRFLMAVESSAQAQTVAEMIRFTGLRVIALSSDTVHLRRELGKINFSNVQGIVVKHGMLRNDLFSSWLSMNINADGTCKIFDTFILDESSVIKNRKTKTADYTTNICNLARRVHMLNATTFEKHIMDIYNQTDMMNERLLPSKSRIEKNYCVVKRKPYWIKENGKAVQKFSWETDGYKNQAEFKDLLRLVYLARSKKHLPHIYKCFLVEPTTEQGLALARGERYMEVLNCPSLIDSMNTENSRKTIPKLERLCTLIENEFEESKVMVYCFHIEAQKAIMDELIKIGRKPIILNGEVSGEDRYDIQQAFNKGEYDVIITNVKKSLNLYGGDVCIFYSSNLTPALMTQVGGRIDRSVDDKLKTFVILLYQNTDEYKYFLQVTNQRAKDSRDLTIDAKCIVDYFMDSIESEGFHK